MPPHNGPRATTLIKNSVYARVRLCAITTFATKILLTPHRYFGVLWHLIWWCMSTLT